MLASFTRDEKRVLVFLAVLLGAGSCLNMFWGSRAEQNFAPVPARNEMVRAGETTATVASTSGGSSVSVALSSIAASGKVDLNAATAEVLESLPGVGPKTAESIITYRREHGGFKSIGELEEVKGLGPAKVEKIAPYVDVSPVAIKEPVARQPAPLQASLASVQPAGQANQAQQSQQSQQSRQQSMQALQPAQGHPQVSVAAGPVVVNINTDGEEKLSELQYVGPVLARRIVQDRQQRGLYPTIESLDRVKGIGSRILQANRYRMKVR